MEIKANTEFKKFIKTASQQIFIAISRIYIIGFGLLDVFPIGTTTKKLIGLLIIGRNCL